jgi:predicted enzyme related to lactoylglutathione lyase
MKDASSGTVSFIEIGAGDAQAIRSFFSAVFGWPLHDNAWLQTPTIKAGTHGDDPTPQIYVYFHAADLGGAAANVRAAGGEASDVVEEPGFGRFVNCRGPGGIQFGLHHPIS